METINSDFSQKELEFIISAALDLISRRELTAINLIHSEKKKLPTDKIIIHHLQSSSEQLKYIESEVRKMYQGSGILTLPRLTFYRFESDYLAKPNFQEDYKNAKFFNSRLEAVDISVLSRNPEGKIVANEELDLLIFGLNTQAIANLAGVLVAIENSGPSPWIDPAIIIKDDGLMEKLKGYVRRDYASVIKGHSEFYSVLPKKGRKRYVHNHIRKLCKNIKDAKLEIREDSLLISEAFINRELNRYIQRNI